MLTPVRDFFKVVAQDWGEWLFAILTGIGSLAIAVLVKLATRYDPQSFSEFFSYAGFGS